MVWRSRACSAAAPARASVCGGLTRSGSGGESEAEERGCGCERGRRRASEAREQRRRIAAVGRALASEPQLLAPLSQRKPAIFHPASWCVLVRARERKPCARQDLSLSAPRAKPFRRHEPATLRLELLLNLLTRTTLVGAVLRHPTMVVSPPCTVGIVVLPSVVRWTSRCDVGALRMPRQRRNLGDQLQRGGICRGLLRRDTRLQVQAAPVTNRKLRANRKLRSWTAR